MKKIILILLVIAVSSVCYSQRIKVHQGNNINSFLLTNVDSITHDGNESVKINYNSQCSIFSVTDVDSLSINSERLECYNILSEQLNGWDAGVFTVSSDGEDFYLVSKTNYDENGEEKVTICINSFTNDVLENTINFIFDNEGNLQEIITAGYQFKALKYLDEFIFVVFKDGDYVGGFNVPCQVVNENGNFAETSSRRLPVLKSYSNPFFNSKGKISLPKIKDFAGKASEILKPIGDNIGRAINLEEGKYGEILMDLVVGGLIGLADLPVAAGIIAEEGVKGLLKYFYEQDIRRLMSDAKIEITSIKRTSETAITVEGVISNLSSIPQTIIVTSDYYNPKYNAFIKDIPNTVYWGIAEGKSGQPGIHLNDNSSGIMPISNNNFSYTFYNDRIPGQVLYFRPFLAPEVSMNSIYTCIRYGERKEYVDMDVELSNFKQTKCYKNNNKYEVRFTIDGSIPGVFQELSGWGFDVKTKSGNWQRFNAKDNPNDYYPPIEKLFTCDITIEDEDITDVGGERIAEISITPFYSRWNDAGLSFLYTQNYYLKINVGLCPDDSHPHMIDLGLPSGTKWACCNVDGYTPLPYAYGNYYTWGETREKTVSSAVKSEYHRPNYDIDLNKYNDHIGGTPKDAAHVHWGDSWRMPTREQINELMDNCIYEWKDNGCLFIGPNGNQIFLPAAGGYYNGSVWNSGTYGRYLSDTGNLTYPIRFYVFCIDKDGSYWDRFDGDTHYGFSIRAVAK